MMLLSFISAILTIAPVLENTDTLFFNLPDTVQVEVVVNPGEIEENYYFSDFYGSPLLICEDICMVLDSPDNHAFKLPFSGSHHEIQWTSGSTFYSKGKEVRAYDKGLDVPVLRTECEDIIIATCEDVGIFYTQGRTLCLLRYDNSQTIPLYEFDQIISDLVLDAVLGYVASGNSVYLVGDQVYEIFTCKEHVNSIALINDEVLLFGTDTGLFTYTYPNEFECIIEKGIRQVRKIGGSIFAVFNDGSSVKITNLYS